MKTVFALLIGLATATSAFAQTSGYGLGPSGGESGLVVGVDVEAFDADLDYLATFTLSANVKTILNAANFAAVRTALSLTIGTNVEAWDADLDYLATFTPSANVKTILNAADFAAVRTALSLTIGTNVEAWDADLDTWATKTAPSGTVVGTTDTQTESGKTFTAPIFTAGTASASSAPKLTSGTVNTAPEAGALEYDGAGVYFTNSTSTGREQWVTVANFMMTGDGSASNTAVITDFFPANSSFSTATSGIYEVIFDLYYLKSTAGTMIFTLTNTQNFTSVAGSIIISQATGISTFGNGPAASIVAAGQGATTAVFPTTASLTNAANHHAWITCKVEVGTAGNIRIRGTPSAGTFTALRGSSYTVRKLINTGASTP